MRLARIVSTPPSALAGRFVQEQLKLLERLHLVGSGELEPRALHAECERFRTEPHSGFFAGAMHDDTPELIAERMPEARLAVLDAAARSLAGRFSLLGYEDVRFGTPIDWLLDPLSGKRSPLDHWSRIDPLDRSKVGDHKVVWELNRHQWLLHWAQAYAFTGDERYAERVAHVLEDWLRKNPTGRGINWASSLELALRVVSWSWSLMLLRRSRAMQPGFFARVLGSMHAQATHVARHLSTTFSPNTHLLGEALGLLYASILLSEHESATAWGATGRRILIDQVERQILPDGVCFEQSSCYQRYTIEMYLHFLALAQRNGVEAPPAVAQRVRRGVDFLLALSRPDGSVPQIGDGDGGWLLPLVPRHAEDVRGTLALAAATFGERAYARAAGGPTLEVAWLFGREGVEEVAALASAPSLRRPSQLFESGGYAVLCDGAHARGNRMVLDVGPLGCPISGAHGHADLLGITCDVFGEPCIVDPGMPTYGGDPRLRDAFRSTALHSSVVVDDRSQATPAGLFAWQSRPRARLRAWLSDETLDFVDGEHDAYRLQGSVLIHRRRIVYVKPRYWVIVDDVHDLHDDARPRRVELGFQFAPGHVVSREDPWVRVATPGGRALLVQAKAGVPLWASVHEGEHDLLPIRGWFSPAYGRLEPAPALAFHATSALPLRVVTMLLPVERADAPVPCAFPSPDDAELLRRLVV